MTCRLLNITQKDIILLLYAYFFVIFVAFFLLYNCLSILVQVELWQHNNPVKFLVVYIYFW